MGARAHRHMETVAAMRPLRTVIIGAGNVASHIVPALTKAAVIRPVAVWSRTLANAEALTGKIDAPTATADIKTLPDNAELYLVSTADEMTRRIPDLMPPSNAIWAHTSGSVPAETFRHITPRFGVFYPLQTLSRGVETDMDNVPIFIEGSDPDTTGILMKLAKAISSKVYEADSQLRLKMHIAAVFACNFTNHLWTIADRILHREAGLDLSVLEPLLKETLRKATTIGPQQSQTGPAIRGDKAVMEKHCSLLPEGERELYQLLSNSILNERNKL